MVKTTRALIVLVVILGVAVAVESFYLYQMNNRVNRLTGKQVTELRFPFWHKALQPQANAGIDENWFNQPFESNTWDPSSEMQRMHEQMNSMLENSFGNFSGKAVAAPFYSSETFGPNVNLKQEDSQYVATVKVPGSKEAAVNAQVEGQVLKINGKEEKAEEKSDKNGQTMFKENWTGEFEESIPLPGPVDAKHMQTKYENGVYTIILPKAAV